MRPSIVVTGDILKTKHSSSSLGLTDVIGIGTHWTVESSLKCAEPF